MEDEKKSDLDRRLTKDLGFGRVLESINKHRHYCIRRKLEKFNLKRWEYRILIELYIEEGVSQEKIACNIGLDKFETSKSIKSLIEKGFVYKDRDENDKRVYRLFLTDKANEIRGEFVDILLGTIDRAVKDVPLEERKIALKVLIHMAERMYVEYSTMKNDKKHSCEKN